MIDDFERCYRAVQSRDPRFDGWFIVAVTSTGIYCRPSCPALTPKRSNVRFHATAAAAQEAGFRACRRCRPDASPGSPDWNSRADVTARAMRLILDGVIDRAGVGGLASELGYSERHVHRLLLAEVGASPVALARAQRAQTARILIETTRLPFSEVAFAAGFASIRQFNAVVRSVFAATPTDLRRQASNPAAGGRGSITLRLPCRQPFDAERTLGFLAARAVPGVEEGHAGRYRRSLTLPRSTALVDLAPARGHVVCSLQLDDLRDLTTAVERCRRLLDLDADPGAVSEALGSDPVLGQHVRGRPGLRVPGSVDGVELAVRAVLGQQVSVKAARSLAGRLVQACGTPLPRPQGAITHAFPAPAAVADAAPTMPLPTTRRDTLQRLATLLADGELVIGPGVDRDEVEGRLLAVPGIGPWTAGYIRMRGLADPDAFLPSDLAVRKALGRLGRDSRPGPVDRLARGWRPWRAYAVQHLWASLEPATAERVPA